MYYDRARKSFTVFGFTFSFAKREEREWRGGGALFELSVSWKNQEGFKRAYWIGLGRRYYSKTIWRKKGFTLSNEPVETVSQDKTNENTNS